MNTKMEQSPAINPNPVLSVAKNGTVLYSNEAGEPLLREWGIEVREKLPSDINEIVQKVISRNSPERMEVKAGKRTYLIALHPSLEHECVNVYGFDISDQKGVEEKVQECEALETANVELSEIVDIQAIQPLMDDLYKLVHIPIGINDLKGNVLAGVGWQDICTKFHRVNLEACKHCIESDSKLSAGVLPGEFKLYKCKNNMWDIVTPIMVGSQHIGYVFAGQFFFDDEPLDFELFRSQAKKYGFNEEEYIAALKKVPRLSREAVETGMSFFMTFANLVSRLSYSNIKLAQSLEKRDVLVDALVESEKSERIRSDELAVLLDAVPAVVLITHDPQALQVTGNRLSYAWLRLPEGSNISKTSPEGVRPETYRMFKDGVEIPLTDMPVRMSASGKEVRDYEFDLVSSDGTIRHLLGNAKPLRDEQGNPLGAVSAFIDITERKKAEEALKKAHDTLEDKVKERTAELEKAYNSLKESEERLAEAQKIAHIGSWECNPVTHKLYWSDEVYRIFGLDPQEFEQIHDVFFKCVHPEDREYVNHAIKEALNGKPYNIDYRIILANGEERIVCVQGEAIFDEKNTPIRLRGVVQDITEHKKSEEKIRTLANIVESSNDAVGTISLDGIITSWNKGAEQVYGYSTEEILGKPVSILAQSNLMDETKRLSELVKKGQKIRNYETTRLRKDGKRIYVSFSLSPVFDMHKKLNAVSFISRDITKRKEAEEALANIEIVRKQEIHHRIKNNLQVISSLLDLQSDHFKGRKDIKDSEVLEAFKESQDRVISMALIHEELHRGGEIDKLNFTAYVKELADNLFLTYRLENANTSLDTDIEEDIFFDLDTSVPLGIIINELVSNSLKYAFSDRDKGEIHIKLHREKKGEYKINGCKSVNFALTVSDDGVGIPENLNIEDLDSLGLQLVTSLVDQLDGELELKRNNGTEFTIKFTVTEKSDHDQCQPQSSLDKE